jgi:hypothetical protein
MATATTNPREKEMAEMRARYAKLRNKKVDEPPKKEDVEETPITKPIKKSNPYIQLICGDIKNVIAYIKKLLGSKRKSKPLDLSWLEKNNRRFWK